MKLNHAINPAFICFSIATILEKTISPLQGFGFSFRQYPGRRELALARSLALGYMNFAPLGLRSPERAKYICSCKLYSGQDNNRSAFTLIEVAIAMAIMSVVLLAILNSQSMAMKTFGYSDSITQATLLAKLQMSRLELEYKGKGFGEIPKENSGDFEDDGHPQFKWKSTFGEDEPLSKIGKLVTGGEKGESKDMEMAAQMAGLNPKIIAETLSKSIQRLTLEVSWQRGLDSGSYSLWTHYLDENLNAIPGLPTTSNSAAGGGSGGTGGGGSGQSGKSGDPNSGGTGSGSRDGSETGSSSNPSTGSTGQGSGATDNTPTDETDDDE